MVFERGRGGVVGGDMAGVDGGDGFEVEVGWCGVGFVDDDEWVGGIGGGIDGSDARVRGVRFVDGDERVGVVGGGIDGSGAHIPDGSGFCMVN